VHEFHEISFGDDGVGKKRAATNEKNGCGKTEQQTEPRIACPTLGVSITLNILIDTFRIVATYRTNRFVPSTEMLFAPMTNDSAPPDVRRSIGAQRNLASAEAILSAAESLLTEEGYGGFSIEKVARRARAGKPTIYKWWPNKAALLLDVYLRQKSIMMPDTGRLEDDICQFVDSVLSYWRDTPAGAIFRSVIAEAQSDYTAGAVLSEFAREREADTSFLIWRGLERREVRNDINAVDAARWIGAYLWYRLLTNQLMAGSSLTRTDIRILVGGLERKK
jgi:AcrR family transcriptional regulator